MWCVATCNLWIPKSLFSGQAPAAVSALLQGLVPQTARSEFRDAAPGKVQKRSPDAHMYTLPWLSKHKQNQKIGKKHTHKDQFYASVLEYLCTCFTWTSWNIDGSKRDWAPLWMRLPLGKSHHGALQGICRETVQLGMCTYKQYCFLWYTGIR